MSKEFECLDRIDKRNYLTEREHKEFLGVVEKALTEYEAIKNAEPSEALDCLETIWCDISTNYINEYVTIKQALQRLETIDNANPSEALKQLNILENNLLYLNDRNYDQDGIINNISASINAIKQALLKAQEPKKYLKWEDLEFKHTSKMFDVKMGDNKYKLIVGHNVAGHTLTILRTYEQQYYFLEADKQIFNDLRLERVEE